MRTGSSDQDSASSIFGQQLFRVDVEFHFVVFLAVHQNGRVQFNIFVQSVDYVLGQFQGIFGPSQRFVVQTIQ